MQGLKQLDLVCCGIFGNNQDGDPARDEADFLWEFDWALLDAQSLQEDRLHFATQPCLSCSRSYLKPGITVRRGRN